MKVHCKHCLPKEGLDLPEFSSEEKEHFRMMKEASPIRAVKELIAEKRLSHRDAKYIVTHINTKHGECNRCGFDELHKEYENCPHCGALNFNWI